MINHTGNNTLPRMQIYGDFSSPGQVVLGDESCSRDCGFKSRHRIVDGHDIFTFICFWSCMVCLKRSKINKKRPGLASLKKLISHSMAHSLIRLISGGNDCFLLLSPYRSQDCLKQTTAAADVTTTDVTTSASPTTTTTATVQNLLLKCF